MRLLADLLRQETGVEWLYTFLRYVTAAGQGVNDSELQQIVEVVFPQRSQVIMATLAEKWLEEGRAEGRAEMKTLAEKWLEEGRAEVRAEMETLAEKRLQEGREQGLEQGREQGLEQGLEQGREEGIRLSILTVLRARLSLSSQAIEMLTQRLAHISDLPQLERLLTYALEDDSLENYLQRL